MNRWIKIIVITYLMMLPCKLFGDIGAVIGSLISFAILIEIICAIGSIGAEKRNRKHNNRWNSLTPEEKVAYNDKIRSDNKAKQKRYNESVIRNNEIRDRERKEESDRLFRRQTEERRKQDAIDATIRAIKYN